MAPALRTNPVASPAQGDDGKVSGLLADVVEGAAEGALLLRRPAPQDRYLMRSAYVLAVFKAARSLWVAVACSLAARPDAHEDCPLVRPRS